MAEPRWITSAEVAQVDLPPGGSTGQVLAKTSNADRAVEWATAAGTGDVVGPASATTGNLAVFADETGKLIEDGGAPSGGGSFQRLGPFKIGAFDGQKSPPGFATADGGTFTVIYPNAGETTTALAWNISAADLKTALEELATIGVGKVVSVIGTDIATGYTVMFSGAFMTELITWDGTNLTGPDTPYPVDYLGLNAWSTELFTITAGETIIDCQHALKVAFDSATPATMAYSDDPDNPFSYAPAWSSYGAASLRSPINLDDADPEFLNISGGQTKLSAGYQRSVKALQIAYWIYNEDTSVLGATLPAIFNNSVPIYAGVQDIGDVPSTGEVWIWVDIVPATAP